MVKTVAVIEPSEARNRRLEVPSCSDGMIGNDPLGLTARSLAGKHHTLRPRAVGELDLNHRDRRCHLSDGE